MQQMFETFKYTVRVMKEIKYFCLQLAFSALKTRVVARGQKNETNPIIIWRRSGLARFCQNIL